MLVFAWCLWKGNERLELGAAVVIPSDEDFTISGARPCTVAESESPRAICSSWMQISGNDIVQSWMERVRRLGVRSVWLTAGPHDGNVAPSALAEFARQGVERLLVIKLKSYAEMDLADLLRFHCESQNPVTEARDTHGRLGVSLLDHHAFHSRAGKHRTSLSTGVRHTPYQFGGYAKRILSAVERQELVSDVLTGDCAMRPAGTQIRELVWIGKGANLAGSARIIGPAYIGARTNVCSGATIGPFASVEHDCVVDCGTTVERSSVLPHTYLAAGLLIRHGLVDGGHLEDLCSGAMADLKSARLGSSIQGRESGRSTLRESAADSFPGAGNSFVCNSVVPNASSPEWLQVQL